MVEEWRPVVGYEGWYSVSNLGRVRRDVGGTRTYAGRICKPYERREGYQFVGICAGSHSSLKHRSVHQLVAEAFIGPRPPGTGVNHLNNIRSDNRPENLEWATPKQNTAHALKQGRIATGDRQGARLHPETRPRGDAHHARTHPEKLARGEHNGNSKLTEAIVRDILTSPLPVKSLAAIHGVSQSLVYQVRSRSIWLHVTVS